MSMFTIKVDQGFIHSKVFDYITRVAENDCTIIINKQEGVSTHQVLLAAVSPFFNNLFSQPAFKEIRHPTIDLRVDPYWSPNDFLNVLKLLYFSEVSLEQQDVQRFRGMLKFFEINLPSLDAMMERDSQEESGEASIDVVGQESESDPIDGSNDPEQDNKESESINMNLLANPSSFSQNLSLNLSSCSKDSFRDCSNSSVDSFKFDMGLAQSSTSTKKRSNCEFCQKDFAPGYIKAHQKRCPAKRSRKSTALDSSSTVEGSQDSSLKDSHARDLEDNSNSGAVPDPETVAANQQSYDFENPSTLVYSYACHQCSQEFEYEKDAIEHAVKYH